MTERNVSRELLYNRSRLNSDLIGVKSSPICNRALKDAQLFLENFMFFLKQG